MICNIIYTYTHWCTHTHPTPNTHTHTEWHSLIPTPCPPPTPIDSVSTIFPVIDQVWHDSKNDQLASSLAQLTDISFTFVLRFVLQNHYWSTSTDSTMCTLHLQRCCRRFSSLKIKTWWLTLSEWPLAVAMIFPFFQSHTLMVACWSIPTDTRRWIHRKDPCIT